MSAAFEIYDDQNEEKSCEYAESLISLREKSESIPLEEREIPIGISFIQEAKLEALDEIKNKEREENSDFDGECKEQECNKQDEGVVPGPLGGRPRPQGGRMDRNCRESTQRAHCENIEEFSTPKLIQTSRLDENEVDDVLRHLLDLIYMPCSNQAMDMDSDSDVEGIYVPEGPSVEHLKMKMGFRLQEGQGEARYILGLGKNCDFLGLNKKNMYYSLKTLCCVASSLQADTLLLEVQEGPQGKVVQTLIRSTSRDAITSDIKVMLLGDTQSGKSTMVGLLTSNQTDDGNGLLRENVHSHKHEIISGETSSLNFHIVAFENNGNTHSYKNCEESNWQKIVDSGAKVFTFVDVGGHEKHKQKVYSALTSVYPDYILLVVSAAQGVTAVTEHHLKMALLAEIPIVIVVTHRDLVTETQLYDLKLKIESSIKKFSDDHYLVAAESSEDNLILSRTLKQRVVIPMFSVSSVNRTNVNLFKSFFALLPVNNILTSNLNLPSEFHAYSTLIKKNQVILTGIVLKGTIKKHQILLFGPDAKDNFKYVEVVNIRNKGVLVRHACAGQICTIEIKVGKFTQLWLESEQDKIVKGMILVDSKAKPEPSSGFVAEISLIGNQDSPVTFYEGYEPVVVTQSIKQACHLAFDGPEIGEIKNTDNDIMEKENCASKINMQLSSNYSDESRAKSSKTLKTMKGTSNKSMKNQKNGRSPRSFGLSSMNQKSLARKTSPEDSSPSQRKKKNQRFIVIQPGETRLLTFKFKFHPEYLVPGQKMAIDDTCVKCVGTIKRVLHTTITPRT